MKFSMAQSSTRGSVARQINIQEHLCGAPLLTNLVKRAKSNLKPLTDLQVSYDVYLKYRSPLSQASVTFAVA